jgi:hypothetical protein
MILSEDIYFDQLQIGKKERGVVVVAYFKIFPLKSSGGIYRVVSLYEAAWFATFQASKVTASLTHSTFESIRSPVKIQLTSQWCNKAVRCMKESVFCRHKSAVVTAAQNLGSR